MNIILDPKFWICLIFIVGIHEFGHLIVAKLYGCKVEIFSIGFGKPLLKKKIGDTVYQIAIFPLGGFCKLKGEFRYGRSRYSFVNKPYRAKLFISLAGCYMNIMTGYFAIKIAQNIYVPYLGYFGILSIFLAIGNLIPFPALDGSYPFLVWLEKKYGKKKGYKLMEMICKIGFVLLIALNFAAIPLLFISK
jgi:membrane-associated protease RseP (regulator of RpoE activity)